ncbi:MAG: hypothetical protein SFX73_20070 [Kofleriaceae bacterium]|nr:hypothetical protein [Kofleriaceae bacterium]
MSRRLLIAGFALAAQMSCGEDPPPVCPTGNCNLPGSTIIKWKFNHYPEWGFDSDGCSDLGAITVRVEIQHKDDPSIFNSLDKTCGEGQLTFVDLIPGTYNVALTPLDIDGNSLVKAPVTGETPAGTENANTQLELFVPYTAWSRAYTGQLLFRIAFNGMSCPADVVDQVLELTIGGQVVDAMTDTGQKVDGQDRDACRPLTEQFAQFVQNLPFGPAKLKIQGTAQNNAVLYEREFDTFIGAGTFNPTFTFDIAPPPDAGVDAMVDAM